MEIAELDFDDNGIDFYESIIIPALGEFVEEYKNIVGGLHARRTIYRNGKQNERRGKYAYASTSRHHVR
jgi:hypothetical protein